MSITIDAIHAASTRIREYIKRTPIMESQTLNQWLGHRILFKTECLQIVGAFKARGALNAIARYVAEHGKPQQIIANSSGNHAQSVAWAAKQFDIPATIYIPRQASEVKAQATQSYGARVVRSETRQIADATVADLSQKDGVLWIPPYNHTDVMAGQGTAILEALEDIDVPVNAIAVPCGGGGLLSGSYVAAKAYNETCAVIGAEPLVGNDAAKSRQTGKIIRLTDSPQTIADGARTLAVGELTFPYIQQADHFVEVDEMNICYWTQWLQHLLKLHIEPTSAMSMHAVVDWLRQQAGNHSQTVVVVLTGGNIDAKTQREIWATDRLQAPPHL